MIFIVSVLKKFRSTYFLFSNLNGTQRFPNSHITIQLNMHAVIWTYIRACLYGAELLGKPSYSPGPSSCLFYKLNGLPGWLFTWPTAESLGEISANSTEISARRVTRLCPVTTCKHFAPGNSVPYKQIGFWSRKASNSVCRVTRLHINRPSMDTNCVSFLV